jgi:hypothetical protein
MTRVGRYAGVSTKEESTEAQVGQLTAYWQARGWTEVTVFRDDGISGVQDNRPDLARLRKGLGSGEIDTIVVSKTDRLSRSSGMILRFWDDSPTPPAGPCNCLFGASLHRLDSIGCPIRCRPEPISSPVPLGA